MKHCSVYFRPREIVVVAYHHTTEGLWVISSAVERLAVDASNTDLGKAVRVILSKSRQGVPSLPYEETAKTLKAVGISSWYAFTRGTRLVAVEEHRGTLTLISTQWKEIGSYTDKTREVVPPNVDDEELGRALRSVLAECG